jgi:hypothetical protein
VSEGSKVTIHAWWKVTGYLKIESAQAATLLICVVGGVLCEWMEVLGAEFY